MERVIVGKEKKQCARKENYISKTISTSFKYYGLLPRRRATLKGKHHTGLADK